MSTSSLIGQSMTRIELRSRMEEPKKRWWKKTSIFLLSFTEFVFELIFAVYILNFGWFPLKYSNPKQIIIYALFECEFPFWWSSLYSLLFTSGISFLKFLKQCLVFSVWMGMYALFSRTFLNSLSLNLTIFYGNVYIMFIKTALNSKC